MHRAFGLLLLVMALLVQQSTAALPALLAPMVLEAGLHTAVLTGLLCIAKDKVPKAHVPPVLAPELSSILSDAQR